MRGVMAVEKPRVLITGTRVRPEILADLKARCTVTQWTASAAMPFEVFQKEAPKADVILRTFQAPFTRAMAEVCRGHVKAVVQAFVGYEEVDVDACTDCGLAFCNAASPSSYTVAEMALTLMLAGRRRLLEGVHLVKSGAWHKGVHPVVGHNLKGATAGIIGMGHIGLVLAGMLRAMGMHVLYYNRHPRRDDRERGTWWSDLPSLCAASDVVVNILPASPATHHMMDRHFFSMMKKEALFVNVGRGDTVVTEDLTAALQEGTIAGAVLDVCDPEPLPPDHPLLSMANVIVTPHMASDTEEVVRAKEEEVLENVFAAFEGRPLTDCVNEKALKERRTPHSFAPPQAAQ